MIPMTAKKPEGFAPDGWKIDVVKRGDLNGDKIDDTVILMTGPEAAKADPKRLPTANLWFIRNFGDHF